MSHPGRTASWIVFALTATAACGAPAVVGEPAAGHPITEPGPTATNPPGPQSAACAALATYYRPRAESEARLSPVRFNPVARQAALPTAADIAAVDGSHVLAFGSSREGLRVFDTAGKRLTLLGSLVLPDPASQLVVLPWHRALVVSEHIDYGQNGHDREQAVLWLVDLTNARHPRVLHTERIDDATVRSATADDGVARVVLSSAARIVDRVARSGESDADVLARNLAAVAAARGTDYLPNRQVTDGDATSTGPLLGCADLSRPSAAHGLGITAVLTLDPDRSGPAPVRGIADPADNAIDSGDRIYATAFDYSVPHARDRGATTVYAFDATARQTVRYLAFGAVPGHVPSADALSARDGVLRMVLGMSYRHGVPRGQVIDRRGVAVLREDGATLRLVGSTVGAGHKDWIETLAWVGDDAVLEAPDGTRYVYDTSDPTGPRLAATVKLPGRVGFVHTTTQPRALAVGPDEGGTSTSSSTTLSFLDLTDPVRPHLVGGITVGTGGSNVDTTPETFGWVPGLDLAAVPLDTLAGSKSGYDAALVRVTGTKLRLIGRVALGDYPRRFLAVGDLLVATTDSTVVLIDPARAKVLDTVRGAPHKG